jgi:hypothetical protein
VKDLETKVFLKRLKIFKKVLTVQERKTLQGQALSGDLAGAQKGLDKLLKQKTNQARKDFAK